jgi:hypothetical protein
MVAVLARQMIVNGITYPVGHRADTIGLREDRFQQLVSLSRIVDTDDPSAARRIPEEPLTQPLFIADKSGVITGAVPAVPVPTPVEQEPVPEVIPESERPPSEGADDMFAS